MNDPGMRDPWKMAGMRGAPPVLERPISHVVDDYEKIVTADLRMLTQYRDLLIDGLHALRHGSPEVTDEFIDRTVDAMTKRITAIKARNE